MDPATMTPAWVEFADAVIAAAVLRLRNETEPDATPASQESLDELVDSARERFRNSLGDDNSFAAIAGNAALTMDEAELLAVVVAGEMTLTRQRQLAFLQEDANRVRVAVQTIGRLLGSAHTGASAVGYDSGLRRAGFVSVSEVGPWGAHEIAVAPPVIWAIVGELGSDPDLPWGVTVAESATAVGDDLIVVTGEDRLRRRQAGSDRAAGQRFVVTPKPSITEEWAAVVREATLTGSGVVVEIAEPLGTEGKRWIERATHISWVVSSRTLPDLDDLPRRPRVEIEAETSAPTDDEWNRAFGSAQPRSHPVTPQQLDELGRAYVANERNLDAAVRRLVGSRLEKLAQRIRPRLGWDDVVLSPDRMAQLREIADTVRASPKVYGEWGFAPGAPHGLVALFSGPSGAGKTLSAEVLAADLGLDIFKLEMSAVVSKYIGETEKNLEEVFDAASAGNLVLFFDEADALFGKRSEVKDARDRYANIEVSYLLQRLERYEGLVVLATNFEKNLDEAFLRRIHARIDFILPGEAERLAIWQLNLPSGAPYEELDLASLAARFQLSGASIRNAAIHAAFLAAVSGTPISMEHLVRGIVRDFRKLGRLVKAAEFGEFFALLS
jgi:ATP-dependent 26S proteasome regulatory subunit